ncbi:MAG TPA: hypothetical protein VMZ91_10885 [Candidatus Paceibacterota bacterium]|nr:hypothetical protein [Candidatus Paceibacterota bacterium]
MGGKFFKNEHGDFLAQRIPTSHIPILTKKAMSLFYPFFEKMEMIISKNALEKKDDHGDLDFVCLVKDNKREDLRQYCEERNILIGHNGPMEHILFPFDDKNNYQIDLIITGDEENYKTFVYFYGKDVTFNSIVGQFARSMDYIFSTDGFFRLVKDARKQNRKFLLTKDLETAYKILMLEEVSDDVLFESPQAFADWIESSPRFDSETFRNAHNVKSHRDARKDTFCNEVYQILDATEIKATVPYYKIDFSEGKIDLNKSLDFEKKILGEEIVEKLLEYIKKLSFVKKPIISGDLIVKLGYPQGPIVGKIIQAVSSRFSEEDSDEDKIDFIKREFQL